MIAKHLIQQFHNNNGITYAYRAPTTRDKPTLCFIPGFKSDFMTSKKSHLVHALSEEEGFGFLSWNHSKEGSVYDWFQQGLALIRKHKVDYFVGASMGLWLSLLLSMEEVQETRGIVGIGGGVDFTERWLEQEVPPEHREDLHYVWKRPSRYAIQGYYEIPVRFLVQSRPALLSTKRAQLSTLQCPVCLIHGDQDKDVSGEKTYQFLNSSLPHLQYVKVQGGDHQLSRDQDLILIKEKIKQMILLQ